MEKNHKLAFAIASIAICFAFFLFAINANTSAVVKFVLAAGSLVVCGLSVSKLYGLDSWGGIILLKSQKGLLELDMLARKHPKVWQTLADLGMVVGFGSFAYFLLPKKMGLKRGIALYAAGTVLLVLLLSIVAPVSMAVLFSLLSGGSEFAQAGSKFSSSFAGQEAFRYFFIAIMALGGIALATTVSILTYAGVVMWAVIGFFTGNSSALANTSPGGVPIIPGINLPLFEGILSLAIVLIVHEGMHAIVARLYKLPLKSAGLVFFGFLPFGAFVDIDEKKLFKAKKEQQNSVFVAGTAANFATSIIFLALFAFFLLAFGGTSLPGVGFIARTLGLTFALNFIVASINLVPLPLFDGYHIMKNGVGNKYVSAAIVYLVAIAFVLTLFPWLFR